MKRTETMKRDCTLPRPLAVGPIILFALLTLAPGPWPLATALSADWQLGIDVSIPYASGEGGFARQTLTAGARLTALDGYDNTWDTVAMGSTILSAYSYRPDLAAAYQFLARDYRFDSYPKQWNFVISSDQDGEQVTLALNPPQAASGSCLGLSLALTDVTASATVDLLQPTYVYTNNALTPRQFQLTASQTVESPPPATGGLFSPRVGTASVLLAWTKSANVSVVGYHVYRKDPGTNEYRRRSSAPVAGAKYMDTDAVPGNYSYLVTTVTSTGCESGPSNEITVHVGP